MKDKKAIKKNLFILNFNKTIIIQIKTVQIKYNNSHNKAWVSKLIINNRKVIRIQQIVINKM